MARRRRKRKRRIFPKIAGTLLCLVLIGGTVVSARYFFPGLFERTEETLSFVSEQQVEFPELTVTAEEVAEDFYYRQLTEKEQTIYRELLQGVSGMEESIRIHAGNGDDAGKVYEFLLYDRPELFWCDGSTRMTIYEDYTEVVPGYTCTKAEKEQRQAEIDQAAPSCIGGIDPVGSE